jgi:hypothetical protein
MTLRASAWIPDDDPERPWDTAAQLAVTWVEQQCRAEHLGGLMVTNDLSRQHGVSALGEFERRHSRTSRRSNGGRTGPGPVLSYVPDLQDLEFSTRRAGTSSLAVVESVANPIAGWAAWLGALNLLTGEPTPAMSDEQTKAVERLKFYGNNAFGDRFGKDRARGILNDLHGSSDFDIAFLSGAVLAAGVSARGVKNLRRISETHFK